MRPILLEIDAELLFKLGWALMAIGAAWAFYGLVRASLGLAGRAGGRGVVSDQLQNVALGGVLGVAGFFATRYVGTPIPLYSYGILLGLAVVLGWVFAVRSAIRAGLGGVDTRVALGLGLALALLGARALFVAMNPTLFEGRGFAEWLNLKNGGLVAWGGLIAGTVAACAYLAARRASPWVLADSASVPLAFGITLAQVGNFLFGSDYGRPAGDFALGVRFPGFSVDQCSGSPAFRHHCLCLTGRAPEFLDCGPLSGSVVELAAPNGTFASLAVHPTQLYDAAFALSLVALLLWSQRRRLFAGQTFLTFVLLYGVGRYLIDLLNHDPSAGRVGLFSTNQLVSLVAVPLALAFFGYRAWQATHVSTPDTSPATPPTTDRLP